MYYMKEYQLLNGYQSILFYLFRYNLTKLKDDFITGITMGVVVIPQGLAFASLAGLPTIYGLYSCVFPPLLYMILGTCPQLNMGVSALLSLLTGSALRSVEENEENYPDAAIELCFYCGIFLTILGLSRLDSITVLLSEPVLTAFTLAAEFNIAFSQFTTIAGISGKNDPAFFIVVNLIKDFNKIRWYCVLCGVINTILLILFKQLNKKYLKSFVIPFEVFLFNLDYIYYY